MEICLGETDLKHELTPPSESWEVFLSHWKSNDFPCNTARPREICPKKSRSLDGCGLEWIGALPQPAVAASAGFASSTGNSAPNGNVILSCL